MSTLHYRKCNLEAAMCERCSTYAISLISHAFVAAYLMMSLEPINKISHQLRHTVTPNFKDYSR